MEHENEYALAARYPRIPLIVDGLEYPETIQLIIDDVNHKFGLWAEAETEFMGAEQDLLEAKAKDAKAFRESVLAGAKDPGDVHEPKAARHVERTRILMGARLAEVNKAGSALADAYKDQGKEIVVSAVAMARAGMESQERLVMKAAGLLAEARETREKALKGLIQASGLTGSVYKFDPMFPKGGSVVMPDIYEIRVKQVCDHIEKLVEKGILFPDPSE